MEILRAAVSLELGTRLAALRCGASAQTAHFPSCTLSGWIKANQMRPRRVVELWKTNLC